MMANNKLFAIAKVTRATGINGEVGVRPLIRQFDEYIDKPLSIGFEKNLARDVKIENVAGNYKKRRFLFSGLSSRAEAESIIGQILFVSVSEKDPLNMLSPDLIGSAIVSTAGDFIGELVDMMSLPAHDVYVISFENKEVLIPVVPEIVTSVDHKLGIIIISTMDGLLD